MQVLIVIACLVVIFALGWPLLAVVLSLFGIALLPLALVIEWLGDGVYWIGGGLLALPLVFGIWDAVSQKRLIARRDKAINDPDAPVTEQWQRMLDLRAKREAEREERE